MEEKSEALRLADALDELDRQFSRNGLCGDAAAELRRLHGLEFALRSCELALKKMATKYMDASDHRDALLAVLKELQESASYWSEYDVPLGIVDRINAAITKAED